jgi:hypothetical protein
MPYYVAIALKVSATIWLLHLAVVLTMAMRDKNGYENKDGFHFGTNPDDYPPNNPPKN